ncbi:hypothetical protein QJ854_gp073 [Moumouvirus goulette]|uniref:Uncharacterized protein n=1 Tax=Moumouvirus goulette TaxID=1247379 RepID=M1PCJ5_9VIRU|nr:hypothetical protein QJ854_gp073 [Moumouvirus goulette]AGF85709.1 hypothetical protein glt_00906 [Moumouvirus goulette]
MLNKFNEIDLVNTVIIGAVIQGSYIAGYLAGKGNVGEYTNSTNYYCTVIIGVCVGAIGSCAMAGGLILATNLFSKLVR